MAYSIDIQFHDVPACYDEPYQFPRYTCYRAHVTRRPDGPIPGHYSFQVLTIESPMISMWNDGDGKPVELSAVDAALMGLFCKIVDAIRERPAQTETSKASESNP